MHCDDAARALHAGEAPPDLDIHLSACESCRLLAEDLSEMAGAFAAARASWAPRADFRVRIPSAPWRRLAIAASLLLLPLAGWALASLRAPAPETTVAALLEDPVSVRPLSDRELLGTLFLEDSGR
jgi:predicted anti-sigma-YlaC factor YlaD